MSEGQQNPSESKKEKTAALEPGSEVKQKGAVANPSAAAEKKTDTKTPVNKKPPVATKDKKNTSSEKKSPRKSVFVLSIFVLLLAAVVAGIGFYGFQFLQNQEIQNKQLADAQQDFQQRLNLSEQRVVSTQTSLVAEVGAREKIAAEQIALNAALQDISTRLGRTSVTWQLAEMEYLLALANQHLGLNQDRGTALSILLTVDQKIRTIGEPGLLPVRKAIADELNALRAVQEVDTTGMALSLGSMIKNIASLPLVDKARIATATNSSSEQPAVAASWRELPLVIWNDIKSLVQVRRHQQSVEPLLPPQEAWYLYQNLRLKLEQARLAVLQGNTKLLQEYLAEADSWLAEFFDIESPAIASTRESIAAMQQVDLKPQLPDITNSQRLLHDYMAQQDSQKPSTMAPQVKGDTDS